MFFNIVHYNRFTANNNKITTITAHIEFGAYELKMEPIKVSGTLVCLPAGNQIKGGEQLIKELLLVQGGSSYIELHVRQAWRKEGAGYGATWVWLQQKCVGALIRILIATGL